MFYRPSLLVCCTLSSLGILAIPPSAVMAQSTENACYPGISLAQEAVKAGKVAVTAQEWEEIAQKWQKAADLLAQVSPEEPCYAEDPNRVESYGNNMQVALQEAEKLPATPLPNLRRGDRGPEVKQLQQLLKRSGHYQGEANEDYDDSTLEAVVAFQTASGLSADGEVGQRTWERLQEAPIIASGGSTGAGEETKDGEKKQKKPKKALSGWMGWAMMGAGGLLVLGGTIFVLLKLFNRGDDEEEYEDEEYEEGETPALAPSPSESAVEDNGAIEPPSDSTDNLDNLSDGVNGDRPTVIPTPVPEPVAATSPPLEKNAEPPGAILPVNQTSRLPKLSIVDNLISQLHSSEPQQRRQAIWELGEQGNSLAVQPLLNLLLDCDSGERTLILAALSQIGVKTIKPMNRALSLSLQDENPEVRKNAIRDFTRMYELIATVSHMMCHAVDDPDGEVREVAEWSVKQLRRISAASNMVKLTSEKPPRPSDDLWDDDDE
ncbi:peptidoglycan-binding protein [Roseofilum casamattae]|uniref:Peptidoglycan-binding protein n=1 Tax=Roseofilum casamattae BLCC-M143 TaxID=3022442 RepID=A0ABT7BUS5_9CYAN|nr:peptidoglycan-binding protein [Roseofilum casamattae]MDJ1182935.1 peptidoglycan-binding protein [Roseofilum casamattae BLCC-M143]